MNWIKTKVTGTRRRIAAGVLAVLMLVCSGSNGIFNRMTARAASFTIESDTTKSMLARPFFKFFDHVVFSGIYYWMKSDGTPIFCVQEDNYLIHGLDAEEEPQGMGKSPYFTDQAYELITLVLQSCGMFRGEKARLSPGEYLAGQSAVWGIQTGNWKSTDQLRTEMETLYKYVADWKEYSAEELIEQSREKIEEICQTIDDYYGDESPYIPAFASKYEDQAPVTQAARQADGSVKAVFSLEGETDEVKHFTWEVPDGWSYTVDQDELSFTCEQPGTDKVKITGRPAEGSELAEQMAEGLLFVVGPKDHPDYQHLAGEVKVAKTWACYLELLPEAPVEEEGSWYLPESGQYRHQETFHASYGAGLHKKDGYTGEALAGVRFQTLEYFDAAQFDAATALDPAKIQRWNGWQVRCESQLTDEEGNLEHRDEKTYPYDKTYCGGHPDPVIVYEGSSERKREELETEAWAAWEASVEACESACEFHAVDDGAKELLEADRNETYQQFVHLTYGYTFQELEAADGYKKLTAEENAAIPKRYVTAFEDGSVLACSEQSRDLVMRAASDSDAEREDGGKAEEEEESENAAKDDTKNHAVDEVKDDTKKDAADDVKDDTKKDDADDTEESEEGDAVSAEELAAGERLGLLLASSSTPRRNWGSFFARRSRSIIWLTSQVEALDPSNAVQADCVLVEVDNYKDVPEETTAEETTPEETTKETTAEETTPEETTPEETTEKETVPETTPTETTPEETTERETVPETTPTETTPTETTPAETTPAETTPPETTPTETTPAETPSSHTPGGSTPTTGGRHDSTLPETTVAQTIEENPVPRVGWFSAQYASDSDAHRNGTMGPDGAYTKGTAGLKTLPKTGDRGILMLVIIMGSAALAGLVLIRRLAEQQEQLSQRGQLNQQEQQGPLKPQELQEKREQEQRGGSRKLCGRRNETQNGRPDGELYGKQKRKLHRASRRKSLWPFFALVLAFTVGIPVRSHAENTGDTYTLYLSTETQSERTPWNPDWDEAGNEDEASVQGLAGTDADGEFMPEPEYTDPEGEVYELDSYKQTERVIPAREEEVRTKVTYHGIENTGDIPETLEYTPADIPILGDENSGKGGEGILEKTIVKKLEETWQNDVQIPVTFYDYGADTFVFQNIEVTKGAELESLVARQQELLGLLGCDPQRYQIQSLYWSGETYEENGLMCRDAMAVGSRLTADYEVSYSGTVRFPERTEPVWEVVYRKPAPETEPEDTEEETKIATASEVNLEETPAAEVLSGAVLAEPKPKTLWSRIHRQVTISISLLILAAVILVSWRILCCGFLKDKEKKKE